MRRTTVSAEVCSMCGEKYCAHSMRTARLPGAYRQAYIFGSRGFGGLGLGGEAVKEIAGPVRLAGMQDELQVGAGFGVDLTTDDDESGAHSFGGVAEAEPGGEGDALGVADFKISQVHGDDAEATGLDEEVRGLEGVFGVVAAADPEQMGEIDAGGFGFGGIEGTGSIDEGAEFVAAGGLGEEGDEQAHAAGRGRAVDFGHADAGDAAGEGIDGREAGFGHFGGGFLMEGEIDVEAMDERRADLFTECGGCHVLLLFACT
jgi:hypothetical protein